MLVIFLINSWTANAAEYQRLLNINFGYGTKTGLSAFGNNTNDVWNLISASDNSTTTNLVWANSNSAAGLTLTITNLPNAYNISEQTDAMLGSFISGPGYDGDTVYASIVVSNLPAGTYSFYCYGFSGDTYYDSEWFTLGADGNNYGPKHTVQSSFDPVNDPLTEGWQYITFTNIVVTNGVATFTLQSGYYSHVVNGLQIVDLTSTNAGLPYITFSPASGAAVPVNVTMSVAGHGDATIYYTTNGTTPTTNSSVYSTAVSISTALTVKAIATKPAYDDAPLSSATYLLPTLPSVSFSPGTGSEVPLSLTLSIAGHSGATIYYTTNGTTPTTSSAVYTGAISLTAETTVKAFGTESGYYNSSVATAVYYLPTAPNPTISPASGSYYIPLTVTISNSLSGADIRYSTNGTTWTTYTAPLAFSNNVVVRAKVVKAGYYDSATITNTYVVEPFPIPATTIEPNGGVFTNAASITLSNSTAGALIEYRVGTNKTWNTYSNAFSLDGIDQGTGFLQVRASKTNCISHLDTSAVFVFVANPPIYSHSNGTYTNAFSLTLTNSTAGSSMQYSFEGTEWTAYTGALTVDHNTTVFARVLKAGYISNGQVGHRSWEGFSSSQGLGSWYYLYATEWGGLPDSFLPLYDTTNAMWRASGDASCNVGKLFQTPSSSKDSVRSFQVPYDGTAIISGLAFQDDLSSYENVRVRILKNDDTILDWVDISATTPVVLTVTNALTFGDEIHFQVSTAEYGGSHRLNFYPTVGFQSYRTFTFTDTDGDGLSDAQEGSISTNTGNVDTDGDGVSDYLEWLLGRNPLVAGSVADTGGLIKFKVYTPLE
jgi:hypothetical protein